MVIGGCFAGVVEAEEEVIDCSEVASMVCMEERG